MVDAIQAEAFGIGFGSALLCVFFFKCIKYLCC